jgi:hypothetical protein
VDEEKAGTMPAFSIAVLCSTLIANAKTAVEAGQTNAMLRPISE